MMQLASISGDLSSPYHISRVVSSQAKISNFHMVLGVEEDIDRFQVPMNHSLLWNKKKKKLINVVGDHICDIICANPVAHLLMDICEAVQYLSEQSPQPVLVLVQAVVYGVS